MEPVEPRTATLRAGLHSFATSDTKLAAAMPKKGSSAKSTGAVRSPSVLEAKPPFASFSN